jgi:hypothetical protein
MLELARQEGYPAAASAPLHDTGLLTYCGPYVGVEKADSYAVRLPAGGRYVREALHVQPAPDEGLAAEARAELVAEVDRILAAGHLAPVNLPWKVAYGWGAFNFSSVRLLYSAPGQALSSLAATLPFLDAERQQRVRAYLTQERESFPPEAIAHLPSHVGARREPWRLSREFIHTETNKLRGQNFHVRTRTLPPQALYDLARYYAAVGAARMTQDGFALDDAAEKTIRPWTRREEWASLGWRSWPLDQRDPQYYGSYGWNQAADVNRQAIGLIGLARLARLAGDKPWERRAMARLARVLARRFAVAKYVGWLYRQGGILPAPEGFSPADDPRAVAVSEVHAAIGHGRNQNGPLPYFSDEEGPYVPMVPELARFLAERLKPEAEAFARATAAYYPDAFLTLGTPRRCAEWWHNYPQDSWQIFMVRAWILGAEGDTLRKHLDVPLVPVGDLYYLDKLAATLAAYGRRDWKPFHTAR